MPVPIIHTLLNSDLSLDMVHGPLSKMKKNTRSFWLNSFWREKEYNMPEVLMKKIPHTGDKASLD